MLIGQFLFQLITPNRVYFSASTCTYLFDFFKDGLDCLVIRGRLESGMLVHAYRVQRFVFRLDFWGNNFVFCFTFHNLFDL